MSDKTRNQGSISELSLPQRTASNPSVTQDVQRGLTPEEVAGIAEFAAKERIRLDAEAQTRDRKAFDARNDIQNHVEAFNSLHVQNRFDGHKVRSEIETASGKMTITSTSGRPAAESHCFVATATYQDAHHPDVEYLRRFRDEYLRRSSAGRAFIRWYYGKAGPYMADVVEAHELLRRVTLAILKGFIKVLRKAFPC